MQPEIEEVVAFTVPGLIPPSGNHMKQPRLYVGRDGYRHLGFRLTDETKAYYNAVAIFAAGRTVAPATMKERRKAHYAVRIDVYLPPRSRIDFDNGFKCGLDAIVKCGLIHSDAAVDGELSKCVVHKDERSNPRSEYTVIRLEK